MLELARAATIAKLNEIASGSLRPGDRLPPIAVLAKTYSVAPVTVREALRVLAKAGLTTSRRGSGTYVVDAPPIPTPAMLDVGWPTRPTPLRKHLGRILEADDRMPPLEAEDGLSASAYRRMLRVHTDGAGEPYALAEIYLDRRQYDVAPQRYDKEMVLAVLEETAGPQMAEMKQSFKLTAADATSGQHLGLRPGDPLGRLRRVLTGVDSTVVYYSITLARADRIAFEWVLKRPTPDREGTDTAVYSGYLAASRTDKPDPDEA